MPLKKLVFKPGVNRESTSYAEEGTWYACDKVRFRSGQPEKIGGWEAVSSERFVGVCRSLFNWGTLSGYNVLGMGTHLKYYVEHGGSYYDITPLRAEDTVADPLTTTTGTSIVIVIHVAHGADTGDYVAISGADATGGIPAATLNNSYAVTVLDADTYTIDVGTPATSSVVGGGAAVTLGYEIQPGSETSQSFLGWGSGGWGSGSWGISPSSASISPMRVWNHYNYGENLLFGPAGGALYFWDASAGASAFDVRGVLVEDMVGASDVPTVQDHIFVSDTSRFVMVFGTNEIGTSTYDPMLIRWSDQEDMLNWTPAITNQAGGVRLSRGTKIVAVHQAKQEILAFTDSALYSIQFVGPPLVWGTSLIGENISIASSRAVASAGNVTYWMGKDKFYVYNGRVDTLPCTLRSHVFNNINMDQIEQSFAGTNEGFNEVWWFYCSAASATVDSYVVFNYAENIWYYGTLARTAWLDSPLRDHPMATGYNYRLLDHEAGNDDRSELTDAPIYAYVESADFDLDDGHSYSFVSRVLPDMTFTGSTWTYPQASIVLKSRITSGASYTTEAEQPVYRAALVSVEQYTEQLYVRLRGRQMTFRVESNTAGTMWQLGAPRIEIRPDGRKV